MRTTLLSAALALVLAACAGIPGSPGAKFQEASQELNLNARFGRVEMAIDRVAPKEREEWARRHRSWGGRVRIADSETSGTRLVSDFEAESIVKVAWYRPDEQELRSTTIKQKWKSDSSGDWKLVAEMRIEGDFGLLGDVEIVPPGGEAPAAPADGPAKRKYFPTIRIGAGAPNEDGEPVDPK
jgi:hypothetical protein